MGAIKSPYPTLLWNLEWIPWVFNFENSLSEGEKKSSNCPIFSVPFASCWNFNQYTHFYSCSSLRLKRPSSLYLSGQLLNKHVTKHAWMSLPFCYFHCYHHRMNKLFTGILLGQHFVFKVHAHPHIYITIQYKHHRSRTAPDTQQDVNHFVKFLWNNLRSYFSK